MRDPKSSAVVRRNAYRPPQFRLDRLNLNVAMFSEYTSVEGELHITPLAEYTGDNSAEVILYGDPSAKLQSMTVNDKPYTPKPQELAEGVLRLTINTPSVIRITQHLKPDTNSSLEGLYKAGDIYCTQCEAEGFRRIMWYPDRPDVLAAMRTRIEADKTLPILLASGNLIDKGKLDGGRHYVVWDDPHPKPSYLFALVAGDLDVAKDTFTTKDGRVVDLRIYVEHDPQSKTNHTNVKKAKHAMASLKKAMAWDEKVYGLSYDLDVYNIVAVSHFNMGAMENKGLNIFNAKCVLADSESATDDELQRIEAIIAHEYFHNWTGNRITCRDWFQLTLKEGLTVFRDQEFTADMHSPTVKRIQDVAYLRAVQFPEDASPTAHPIRPDTYQAINNFYTPTVYEKGAEVVRMLQQLLGREGFMKGMALYIKRHDGEAVSCEEFIHAMADANHTDLTPFFAWYSQSGTPEVAITREYDEGKKTLTLNIKQTLPQTTPANPKNPTNPINPLVIPIRLGLISKHGKPLPLHIDSDNSDTAHAQSNANFTTPSPSESPNASKVIVLAKKKDSICLTQVPKGAVPSLLRGFSAPVHFHSDLTDDERLLLLTHDSDGFCRWQAAQDSMLAILLDTIKTDGFNRDIKTRIDALALALTDLFTHKTTSKESANKKLANKKLDSALLAELLTPPAQAVVESALVKEVDPTQVWRVRRKLRRALAGAMGEVLSAKLEYLMARLPRLDAGKRRLLQVLVLMLADAGNGKAITHAINLASHDRMSLCMAGLGALNHIDHPQREIALDAFADTWQADPLVMEKYFALSASAPLHATPQYCEGLMQHPAFDASNPNKLRAVIGVFANANIPQFHGKDGAGYRFLTRQVASIDKRNPQMAARLVLPLTRYGRYSKDRQAMMRGCMIRLKTESGLSPDLTEIIDKTLTKLCNGNGNSTSTSNGTGHKNGAGNGNA
ncbi:MAG: aminopeptidase N [Proteobacteria bacterium]|nr:aminopeptidase N [Pseudomonadota bacterium]